jgi:hypothetical protein
MPSAAFRVASQSACEAQIAFTYKNAFTNSSHSREIERSPLLLEKDDKALKGGLRVFRSIKLTTFSGWQSSHVRPRVNANEVGIFPQEAVGADFFAANPPAA